jgi:hypothetical protein
MSEFAGTGHGRLVEKRGVNSRLVRPVAVGMPSLSQAGYQ